MVLQQPPPQLHQIMVPMAVFILVDTMTMASTDLGTTMMGSIEKVTMPVYMLDPLLEYRYL
jgi:hypothetical protein